MTDLWVQNFGDLTSTRRVLIERTTCNVGGGLDQDLYYTLHKYHLMDMNINFEILRKLLLTKI